jgi:6-pyruvoyltetrahydropterin/6-carboxytetrahydropterin synthase
MDHLVDKERDMLRMMEELGRTEEFKKILKAIGRPLIVFGYDSPDDVISNEIQMSRMKAQEKALLNNYLFYHIPIKICEGGVFSIIEELKRWQSRDLYQPALEITKIFSFSYAHRLDNLDLPQEICTQVFGACNNMHGHNMKMEVAVKGWVDPETGMVINFNLLKKVVQENILSIVDHQLISYRTLNAVPTCESMALAFLNLLVEKLPVTHSIKLYETDTSYCYLTR